MRNDPPSVRCVLLGAGGHARTVAHCARRAGVEMVGCIVGDGQPTASEPTLPPILGTDSDLARLVSEHGIESFHVVVGRMRGGEHLRDRIFAAARDAGLVPATLLHPDASIADPDAVGAGTAVLAGAVLEAGVHVGENAIVNAGAILCHDTQVGDGTHIAPGATLGGGVTIGARSLVGLGASVMPGVAVGDDATIGAGAVVVKDVPPGATVVGTPAQPI